MVAGAEARKAALKEENTRLKAQLQDLTSKNTPSQPETKP
jgi:uncharacterized small protein (DUF1192 family)